MTDPQQHSAESRLQAVRQIGFTALSAIDGVRNIVLEGAGDRALSAIDRVNAERVGDHRVESTLRGELGIYEKLASVAERAAELAVEIEAPLLPDGWAVRETLLERAYYYQGGNAQVRVSKGNGPGSLTDRDSMTIKVFGADTWTGYVGDAPGFVSLAAALTRAQETLANPSKHLGPAGVAMVEAAKNKLDGDRADAVATLREEARDWEETAARGRAALLGERFIVLDRHERAFSLIEVDGEKKSKLALPDATLVGVSILTKEAAEKTRAHLQKMASESAPFAVWDFQEYAERQALKSQELASAAMAVKWTGGREATNLHEAKELAEVAMARLGMPRPESWRKSMDTLSPWEYAELEVGGYKKLTVGASAGGVVAIDGDPFTPGERAINTTLVNVEQSMQVARRALILTGSPETITGGLVSDTGFVGGLAAKNDAREDLSSHRSAWRTALVSARDGADARGAGEDERLYWENELRAFDAAHAELAGSSALPDDIFSHRDAWRGALELALESAEVRQPDLDDKSYWRHEIEVFDRVYATLLEEGSERRVINEGPELG